MATVEMQLDPEREQTLAGLMILEAVNDSDAWALFWRAVMVARSKSGSGEGDAPSG